MKRIVSGGLALLVGLSLAVTVTQPAVAYSWITAQCQSLLYHHNTMFDSDTPNVRLRCQEQAGPASVGGYNGPANGVPGVNTYKGIQTYLRDYGYTGPINGVIGPNGYKAMQRAANSMFDCHVPVDGVMDTRDWQCWGNHVFYSFYSD